MPWTSKDAKHHNKRVRNGREAAKWADTANAVFKETGSEGEAIATANKHVHDHRHPAQFKDKK